MPTGPLGSLRGRPATELLRVRRAVGSGPGAGLGWLGPPVAATVRRDRHGGGIGGDGGHEGIGGRCGPHRLRSGWWETPLIRDYYRVLLAGGDGLLVYHEPPSDRWFVQGVVD